MTVLRETRKWRREPAAQRRWIGKLKPDEEANVRAALRALHKRMGTWAAVAGALGISQKGLECILYGERTVRAGHALCTAEVAGVSIGDVLSGAFAKPKFCPTCGKVQEE